MSSNQSDFNLLPIYKLYFDDIEEIFLDKISIKYLLISSIIICLLILISTIMLLYNSHKVFLACLIPFIYSLLFYDFIELVSIVLLKYNLSNTNEKYFGEICRWPYYLKATSEAGQCIALIFLCAIRSQKVRYFLKHNHLPNSTHVHSRVLTFVCVLFIIYVNNWITHLKVEKTHLVTLNESNYSVSIQEYPISFYSLNNVKVNNHERFYIDLDFYAQNYDKNYLQETKSGKIIEKQKDESVHEIIIKIPYNNFFGQHNSISSNNRSKRDIDVQNDILNLTMFRNNSYKINRCTYGQKNFFLANFLSFIHSIFYFILICHYVTTVYRYRIPEISNEYCQKLYHEVLHFARKKSAERLKQLSLLKHLKNFQYLLIYCYTTLTLIRLIGMCSFTCISCITQAPFQWSKMKFFYYSLFTIVHYSIPVRLMLLSMYLFFSLYSTHIHSIFYYVFHTKLHFSCKFQKPTIRLQWRFVQHRNRNFECVKTSKDSLVLDVTSSGCDEPLTSYPNETIAIYDENSSSQNPVRASSCVINVEFEHSKV